MDSSPQIRLLSGITYRRTATKTSDEYGKAAAKGQGADF